MGAACLGIWCWGAPVAVFGGTSGGSLGVFKTNNEKILILYFMKKRLHFLVNPEKDEKHVLYGKNTG